MLAARAAGGPSTVAPAGVGDKGLGLPAEKDTGLPPPCNGGILSHVAGLRPNKSVSFANVENILHEPVDQEPPEVSCVQVRETDNKASSESDDDEGIFFTVPANRITASAAATAIEMNDDASREEFQQTAVESSLPWKRITGREPMSSTQTHTMPDDCHPLRADLTCYTNMPSPISSASDDRNLSDSLGVSSDGPPSSGRGRVADVSTDAGIVGSEGCTANNMSADLKLPGFEEAGPSSIVEDLLPTELPLPWRSNRKSDTHLLSALLRNDERSTGSPARHGSFPRLSRYEDDSGAEGLVATRLPWRRYGNDAVMPDQHAPRPLQSVFRPTDLPCSPTPSCLDGISMHPQASCQSFRLSEAESRHSEPVHLHHVIDMPSSHRLPPSPVHEPDALGKALLSNIEECFNSRERVYQWLETLTEYSDSNSIPEVESLDDVVDDGDDVESDVV